MQPPCRAIVRTRPPRRIPRPERRPDEPEPGDLQAVRDARRPETDSTLGATRPRPPAPGTAAPLPTSCGSPACRERPLVRHRRAVHSQVAPSPRASDRTTRTPRLPYRRASRHRVEVTETAVRPPSAHPRESRGPPRGTRRQIAREASTRERSRPQFPLQVQIRRERETDSHRQRHARESDSRAATPDEARAQSRRRGCPRVPRAVLQRASGSQLREIPRWPGPLAALRPTRRAPRSRGESPRSTDAGGRVISRAGPLPVPVAGLDRRRRPRVRPMRIGVAVAIEPQPGVRRGVAEAEDVPHTRRRAAGALPARLRSVWFAPPRSGSSSVTALWLTPLDLDFPD